MTRTRPNALLEQVPLMVSPFVKLPTAPTLSYNYKPMPSSLPPSIVEPNGPSPDPSSSDAAAEASSPNEAPKAKYVVSPSTAHAAHPEEILASCRALQAHLDKMRAEAERDLAEWDERLRERDLAEKRRVAPGWLDSEERMLQPERPGVAGMETNAGEMTGVGMTGMETTAADSEMSGMANAMGAMNVAGPPRQNITQGMQGLSLWDNTPAQQQQMQGQTTGVPAGVSEMGGGGGEELDRMFGGRP